MNYKLHKGFTMIETLVSIVIISIGVLGFALLQIESLKAAKVANERTKAIHFATDMMDRMRANKSEIPSYDTAGIAGPPGGLAKICVEPAAGGVTCDGKEMAAYEVSQWKDMIADPNLGFGATNGQAGIDVSGTNPWTVQVTIRWTEKADTNNYILTSVIN